VLKNVFKKMVSSIFVLLALIQSLYPLLFNPSDLPVVDGEVYHLRLKPEQLAPNVILVGDPERVPFLAQHCLTEISSHVSHRGLCTITGRTKSGLHVSIVTSGMGTPSTEIVINELIALNEIDLERRERRPAPLYEKFNIIRLGTSGGLQESTTLGMPIISVFAVGLDNTGLFYDARPENESVVRLERLCKSAMENVITEGSRFAGKINPYAAMASKELAQALCDAAGDQQVEFKRGITLSNSGFFANQGRDIVGIPLSVPDIDGCFARADFEGLKFENMEMESSFIFYFCNGLNQRCGIFDGNAPLYRAGAVCPAIANRRLDTFDAHYEENVLVALRLILRAFERLR